MTTPPPSTSSALASPHDALAQLLAALKPVGVEQVALDQAAGRVLAQAVTADRPSPACDVSAMDGYALRLGDAQGGAVVPVAGEVAIGHAPPALPAGSAVRIFTGGALPGEAELVIKREDVHEEPEAITLPRDLAVTAGLHIRRQGENLAAGEVAVEAGRVITPAVVGVLASFGVVRPRVHQRVRLGVVVTGNELHAPQDTPEPWGLRDSNGPVLTAMFGALPWVALTDVRQVADDPALLARVLGEVLDRCDAVLLTGGVSMGDHDHVPGAVQAVGGRTVFHKVALRPGKPMLGAVGPQGQLIMGLPGNPVSVMVTARRFAAAALRRRAGHAQPVEPAAALRLQPGHDKPLGLWWYRPVQLRGEGAAQLVPSMGSGDVVSAARGEGFVEIPPHATGEGPWPYYAWAVPV